MLLLKSKKIYLSLVTTVAEVDLEGIICDSVILNVRVNSLENMNNPDNPLEGIGDASGEVFYFES